MLTQKGTQRIEVIVRKQGGSLAGTTEKSGDEVAGENSKSTFWGRLAGSEDRNRIKRVINTNVLHSISTAKQVGDLAIERYIGGIGYRNGDQALQDNVQRTVEKITDVTNTASNVARGVAFGAWGGPLGMLVGGTLAAVSSISSVAFKYLNRERDFSYKVFKENNSIEYQRARAQISLTNGRLR